MGHDNQDSIAPANSPGIESPPAPARRFLRNVIAVVIPAIVLFFVGRAMWSRWETVTEHSWKLDVWWLTLSAVVFWADFIVLVYLWRSILLMVSGKRLPFMSGYRISALSNLGKYVPGKVWTVLGMVYFLKREGYAATSALAATGLHQAYTLVAGGIFVSVVLGAEIWGGLPAVSVFIGVGLSALIVYPPVFSFFLNRGLRLFKRDPLPLNLSFGKALMLLSAYVLAWVLYGSSFWCMLRGIGFQDAPFWNMVAASGAAYLLGFLALFAPGGLGVREGVLLVLVSPYVPAGLAATIAVVARVWMTIIELLGLLPVLHNAKQMRFEQVEKH